MRKFVIGLSTLFVLGFASHSLAVSPRDCLVINNVDRQTTTWTNICNGDISVFYCSSTNKKSGKLCGENHQSANNKYFTHVMTMKPGDKRTKYNMGSYEFAVCSGWYDNWTGGDRDFESNYAGQYRCNK